MVPLKRVEQKVNGGAEQAALPAALLLKPPGGRAGGFVGVHAAQADQHEQELVEGDGDVLQAQQRGHKHVFHRHPQVKSGSSESRSASEGACRFSACTAAAIAAAAAHVASRKATQRSPSALNVGTALAA